MNETNNNLANAEETLLEFPCEFPLKIMGTNHENFVATMCDLVSTYITHEIDLSKIVQRASTSGKYLALTISFTAESKQQVDDIYQALYEHADVKMTL